MGRDLFAAPSNGHHFLKPIDEFKWIVGVFKGDGATQVIQRAYKKELKTFYPIRRNIRGEYTPLWKAYLFIQFIEGVSIELCRTTSDFIKVVSERDEDGLLHPILVRKEAVNESMKLMTMGKFDDVVFKRRAYGKGSIVRVLEGNFIDTKVRLEMDVTPDMPGRTNVKVDINGLKATIELFKLAL
jgi:transcription antitermination factor NusG